jgi:cell division transport system ATP-binding protein
VIEFEDVAFSYGERDILKEVSFSLEPGSFTFLLGPSGSGKTTLLRLCYLDLVPVAGSVRCFGQRIRASERNRIADLRRAIGVVHQECSFLDHLSVLENIALPLQISGIDATDRAEDLDALLEWVDLTGKVKALPPQMSGDERQRAAVARAVILSPDVVLADEPAGNVDGDMALRILTLFIELNRMGKTIFIATHDASLVRTAQRRTEARVLALEGCRPVPKGGAL